MCEQVGTNDDDFISTCSRFGVDARSSNYARELAIYRSKNRLPHTRKDDVENRNGEHEECAQHISRLNTTRCEVQRTPGQTGRIIDTRGIRRVYLVDCSLTSVFLISVRS